jgi:xylan 1,4-beta-xylosidase
MRRIGLALVAIAVLGVLACASFEVDVSLTGTEKPFKHFWKKCFGSGHARLALRADFQAQLQEIRNELGIERVRFHGIFDDDLSVVLDTPNNYEFFNIDQIYRPLVQMGIKPIVELSFMPGLLAGCAPWVPTGPECQYVMHYHGIVMPPTNYSQWTDLVQAFATHLISTFGQDEVRSWHFEVWNELWGMPYPTNYLALYDASRAGLKAADSKLQIGGPVTMQCQYIQEFVTDRAGQFDFVSTHLYPTDPNCTGPGTTGDIDCFAHTIQTARSQAPANMPFFVTEYNAGLFDPYLLYSSFAAGFIFRNVPQLHDVLDVWSYWTFTDIFEESGMHSAPFEGFNYGIQTNRGIKKPAYRAFQLLKGAGSTLLPVHVTQNGAVPPINATVTAFATPADGSQMDNQVASIFLSNFAPQGFAITTEIVTVRVNNFTACSDASAVAYYIDANNANPYAAWEALGSPTYPTDVQLATIKAASELKPTPLTVQSDCSVQIVLLPYSAVRVDVR